MTTRTPAPDPQDPDDASDVDARIAAALAPLLPDADRGAALRRRVLERARASRGLAGAVTRVRRDEGEWRDLARGVRVKLLHESAQVRSVLVDLAPGAAFPAHRHHEHEECVVLRGAAKLGEFEVRKGDFHVAPAGSRHGRVTSRDGALLYLRGVSIGRPLHVARDLMTAWIPRNGPTPRTVAADAGDWDAWLPGVDAKALWGDGASQSVLVRMQPGARLPGHALAADEECLLIDGELLLDDTLLRAGDYQLARAGTPASDLASDVGALFYVHGARRSGVPLPG